MKDFTITKKGQGRRFALREGTAMEMTQDPDAQMLVEVMAETDLLEALYYTLEPGATSGDATSHRGQEMHMVVQGEVMFSVGEEKVTATKGDVVWHRSERTHAVTNVGTIPCVVFLVNLPPIFNW